MQDARGHMYWRRLILIGLVLLLLPRPSRADETSAARASYESATRHYNVAEYEEALQDFKDGYRLKPDPAFLYNIGQCHRMLGHVDEALALYKSYLREAPEAKNRGEVERKIDELQAQRAAVAASPPPTSMELGQAPGSRATTTSPGLDLTASNIGSRDLTGSRPVYREWWFWTAAAAVAAGAAISIGYFATRDPTKIPTSDLGSQRVLQ